MKEQDGGNGLLLRTANALARYTTIYGMDSEDEMVFAEIVKVCPKEEIQSFGPLSEAIGQINDYDNGYFLLRKAKYLVRMEIDCITKSGDLIELSKNKLLRVEDHHLIKQLFPCGRKDDLKSFISKAYSESEIEFRRISLEGMNKRGGWPFLKDKWQGRVVIEVEKTAPANLSFSLDSSFEDILGKIPSVERRAPEIALIAVEKTNKESELEVHCD